MPHRPASVLRLALLALIAALGLAAAPAQAEDQVYTIPDYATARENITPRHAQAWRIYEYYRINRVKRQNAVDEHAFLRREVEDVAPGGLLAGLALSQEELGQKMQAAQARRAEAEEDLSTAERFWSNSNFDIHLGVLSENFDRMVKVRYEDPDRPGQYVETEMNVIEYRLYNGKRLDFFKAPDAANMGDGRPGPASPPANAVAAPGDCPPCPAGKTLCYCDAGKAICYDPSKGEGCLMPTDREACTGPACPDTGAGGITSILRGN